MTTFEQAKLRFLKDVARKPEGARRLDLPSADRANDLVRQKCRREGLVVFENRGPGHRWHITDAGLALIEKEGR